MRQSMGTTRQLTRKQIDFKQHTGDYTEADRGNERAVSLISEIATLECPHPLELIPKVQPHAEKVEYCTNTKADTSI